MELSDEAITEFKGLYLKHWSVMLTDAEARAQAAELMALVKAIQPSPAGSGSQNP